MLSFAFSNPTSRNKGDRFYYLQSRYYNPTVSRFLNADAFASTGQGLLGNNMFAYCLNNPNNFADSTGWFAQAIGLFIKYELQFSEEPPNHPKDVPPDHPDFEPPKKGNRKVKNPNGKGWGWVDNKGNVWVWNPGMHGGEGWVVQEPNGGHSHAYPGGGTRNHFTSLLDSTNIIAFPSAQLTPQVFSYAGGIAVAGGMVVIYYMAAEGFWNIERRIR